MAQPYIIKYESMEQLYDDMTTRCKNWNEQLDAWKRSYQGIIDMKDFEGASAVAAKSYLKEVHGLMIQSIETAMKRLQADYLLYKTGYGEIDTNIYTVLPEAGIEAIETKLNNEVIYLATIIAEISQKLNSVSDIYWRGTPNADNLRGSLATEKGRLHSLDKTITAHENTSYKTANGEVKELLTVLHKTINGYIKSPKRVASCDKIRIHIIIK